MFKSMLKNAFIALSAIVLIHGAHAQTYVHGNVGKADLAFNDPEPNGLKTNHIGYKAIMGAMQEYGFAYEAQLISYGRRIAAKSGTTDVTGIGFNVAKHGVLDQYLDYRVAAGIGWNSVKDSSADQTRRPELTLSAGVSYKINRSTFVVWEYDISHVRLQYGSAPSSTNVVNLVSLGIKTVF